jgi:putative two-component system response regulator
MHDLGKIGIPDTILLKAAALTEAEFTVMKEHTRIGESILSRSGHPKIQMSAAIALNHHEKWNGEGYPRGLRGIEIPAEARIVAICDQYDSLRSERPYKPAMSHDIVLRVLIDGDGRTKPEHFDPDVLRAFIKKAEEFREIFDRLPSR